MRSMHQHYYCLQVWDVAHWVPLPAHKLAQLHSRGAVLPRAALRGGTGRRGLCNYLLKYIFTVHRDVSHGHSDD